MGAENTMPRLAGGGYFVVPRAFFTSGWLTALPGAALATLFALFDAQSAQMAKMRRSAASPPPVLGFVTGSLLSERVMVDEPEAVGIRPRSVWVPPSEWERRYRLSEDTWHSGIQVLEANRVISTYTHRKVQAGQYSKRVYIWLRRSVLSESRCCRSIADQCVQP